MKKIVLSLLVVLSTALLMTACKSKQAATSSQYAPWLQEKLASLNERYSEVTLFEIDGQPYYSVFVKGPEKSYDMNRTTIYDANGEEYLTLGGPRRKSEKEINFFRNAENKGVIWQSDIAKEKNKE